MEDFFYFIGREALTKMERSEIEEPDGEAEPCEIEALHGKDEMYKQKERKES